MPPSCSSLSSKKCAMLRTNAQCPVSFSHSRFGFSSEPCGRDGEEHPVLDPPHLQRYLPQHCVPQERDPQLCLCAF
jgi:hypothetical protein